MVYRERRAVGERQLGPRKPVKPTCGKVSDMTTDVRRTDFTVSAAIVHDGKILVLLHGKLNKWLLPGGHVEQGETPEAAVLREAKEETGLDVEFVEYGPVKTSRELKPVPFHANKHGVGDHDHYCEYYLCKAKTSEFTVSHESAGMKWMTLGEVNASEELPEDIKALARYALDDRNNKLAELRVRSAVGAVIVQNGRLLLVHKIKRSDVNAGSADEWNIPVGGMKPGESADAAVMREIKEELGTTLVKAYSRLPQTIIFKFPSGSKFDIQETALYRVELAGLDFKKNEEIDAAEFVPIAEALERIGFEETREALRQVLA